MDTDSKYKSSADTESETVGERVHRPIGYGSVGSSCSSCTTGSRCTSCTIGPIL